LTPARRAAVLLAVALGAGAFGARASSAAFAQAQTVDADDALAFLGQVEKAWNGRDSLAYLARWDFASPEARAAETGFAAGHMTGDETHLRLQRPTTVPTGTSFAVNAEAFTVVEPKARIEQWVFLAERRAGRWALVGREPAGGIDGLIHLSLDPAGFRADGLTLRLPDFELRMDRGTLFTTPAAIGPTALVFIGEGTVRVSPAPPAEQEQLRQYSGKREMVERVRAVFARIHPADLYHVLFPVRLEPDAAASGRAPEADRFFHENVQLSFVLDASLPGSPWWMLPTVGDASVSFRTVKRGLLTFTVSTGEPEGISFFDRARRRQICLYPLPGHETRYDEDEKRNFDVLRHDLTLHLEPARFGVAGEDTLRIRQLGGSSMIRLRLDDSLRVLSVTSPEGGNHLFFRVRNQHSLMVALGPLTVVQEFSLTVRYAGTHKPGAVEREVQFAPPEPAPSEEDVPIEPVLVYANRTAWYPYANVDDYALATVRIDTPREYTGITGGIRTVARVEGMRKVMEFRQDQPGKYITLVVGRFIETGVRQDGSVAFRAYGLSRTQDEASRLLARAGEILRFFETEFGPFPYPSLTLVAIEGFTPGGHSPPGMVVMAERPKFVRRLLRDDPAGFNDIPDFFLAHELAHQWWGHGVAGENYRERWLSEGAAQYAAALWVRHDQGEDVFRGVLRRMAQWALRETGEGPLNLGFRLGHVKGDPQIYRAVVYDKGAYILHMLRQVVGDQAFRLALVAFQSEHRFAKAGTEHLQEVLQRASGRDLSAYFREWVYGTRLPQLHLAHRTEPGASGFRTLVEVGATDLPGTVPLEIAVVHGAGRETRTVMLEPGGGRFTVETAARPRKVELNADRDLLLTVSGS
jgi:peptidase M1-like protein